MPFLLCTGILVGGGAGSGTTTATTALHNHAIRIGTLAPTASTPAEGPGVGTILLQINEAGVVTWRAEWEGGEGQQHHTPTLFTVHGVGKPYISTARGAKGAYIDTTFDDVNGEDKVW